MNEIARLSPSIAKTLLNKSPKHAWLEHRLLGGMKKEPSDSMIRGKILEAHILNGGVISDKEYEVLDFSDYRTKEAQGAKEAVISQGRTPVLQKKIDEYAAAGARLKQEIAKRKIDLRGLYQHTVNWEYDAVPCKGVLDIFNPETGIIIDLKSTEDASPEGIQRSFVNFGYDLQDAAYPEGIVTQDATLAGRVKMLFIFFEVAEPFGIAVRETSGTMKEYGRSRWERAKRLWGECLKIGKWPGYPEGIQYIDAPGWLLSKEEQIKFEDDMTHSAMESQQ